MSKKVKRVFALNENKHADILKLLTPISEAQPPDTTGTPLEQMVKAFAFTPASERRVVMYLETGIYTGTYIGKGGDRALVEEWLKDTDNAAKVKALYDNGINGSDWPLKVFSESGKFDGQLTISPNGAQVAVVFNVPKAALAPLSKSVPKKLGGIAGESTSTIIDHITAIISHKNFIGAVTINAFKGANIPDVLDVNDEAAVKAAMEKLNPERTTRGYTSMAVRAAAIKEWKDEHSDEGKEAKKAVSDEEAKKKSDEKDAEEASKAQSQIAKDTEAAIDKMIDDVTTYFTNNPRLPSSTAGITELQVAIRELATDILKSAAAANQTLSIKRDELIKTAIENALLRPKDKIKDLLGIEQMKTYSGPGNRPSRGKIKSKPDATSQTTEPTSSGIATSPSAPAEPPAEAPAPAPIKNMNAAFKHLGVDTTGDMSSVASGPLGSKIGAIDNDELDLAIRALVNRRQALS